MAFQYVNDVFWARSFWLPPNCTWVNMTNTDPTIYKPQTWDMLYAFPLAVVVTLLRFIVECFIFTPIGRMYNLKERQRKRAASNDVLETVFKKCRSPADDEIKRLAEELSMPEVRVAYWFRTRRQEERPSTMKRFTEAGWRTTFYALMQTYGTIVLWDKDWLWDTRFCWLGYPNLHIPDAIFWYYMIETGFYTSAVFTQLRDVKRKDFTEMIVHHIATLALLVFSWILNFVRIGSLVLVAHDIADVIMEGAKTIRYLGYSNLCNALFVAFTFCWLFTRLVFFPFYIIRSTFIETVLLFSDYYAAHIFFNFFLFVLLGLHIFWFALILKIAARALRSGEVEKDVRSETDESPEELSPASSNGTITSPEMNGFYCNGNGKKLAERSPGVRHRPL